MGRVLGTARGRTLRAGLIAGVVVATVLGLAAPAWTCDVIASGSTECAYGEHVIHWSIGNSESTIEMTIESAVAANATRVFSVDGWTSPVPISGTTSATTIVPGGVTGVIDMRVQASWPNGIKKFEGASVTLISNCTGSTTTTTEATTTTQPQTTTTQPQTTTTEAATTTSTSVIATTTIVTTTTTKSPTSTTVSRQGRPGATTTTTTKPASVAPTLPFTGSGTTYLFIFGLCVVTVGGSILMYRRNALTAQRGHATTAELRRRLDKKKRTLWVYLPPR